MQPYVCMYVFVWQQMLLAANAQNNKEQEQQTLRTAANVRSHSPSLSLAVVSHDLSHFMLLSDCSLLVALSGWMRERIVLFIWVVGVQ